MSAYTERAKGSPLLDFLGENAQVLSIAFFFAVCVVLLNSVRFAHAQRSRNLTLVAEGLNQGGLIGEVTRGRARKGRRRPEGRAPRSARRTLLKPPKPVLGARGPRSGIRIMFVRIT